MSEPKLILNRIKCNECMDIITSTHRHDFVTCKCGKNSVDGGLDYARRVGNTYTELSHNDDLPIEELRKYTYRTGFGKPGSEDYGTFRLTFYKDMSDDYLNASIKYCKDYGQRYDLLEKELEYRKLNNIIISE